MPQKEESQYQDKILPVSWSWMLVMWRTDQNAWKFSIWKQIMLTTQRYNGLNILYRGVCETYVKWWADYFEGLLNADEPTETIDFSSCTVFSQISLWTFCSALLQCNCVGSWCHDPPFLFPLQLPFVIHWGKMWDCFDDWCTNHCSNRPGLEPYNIIPWRYCRPVLRADQFLIQG